MMDTSTVEDVALNQFLTLASSHHCIGNRLMAILYVTTPRQHDTIYYFMEHYEISLPKVVAIKVKHAANHTVQHIW